MPPMSRASLETTPRKWWEPPVKSSSHWSPGICWSMATNETRVGSQDIPIFVSGPQDVTWTFSILPRRIPRHGTRIEIPNSQSETFKQLNCKPAGVKLNPFPEMMSTLFWCSTLDFSAGAGDLQQWKTWLTIGGLCWAHVAWEAGDQS